MQESTLTPKKRFRVLTYNIIHFPRHNPLDKDYYRKPRLRRIAKEIQDFDIVCFQEMYRSLSENLDLFVEELQKYGFEYFCTTPLNPMSGPHLVDGGLMIVSKHRIILSESVQWTSGIFQDGMADKGGLYCQVEVTPGVRLHVMNIHIQAIYCFHNDKDKINSMMVRHVQLAEMKEWLFRLYESHGVLNSEMFLLCGDFNCEAEREGKVTDGFIREFINSGLAESLNSNSVAKIAKSKNIFDYLVSFLNLENDCFEAHELVFEDLGCHPISFGETLYDSEGNALPAEAYLTDYLEYCFRQRLDYIFELKPKKIDKIFDHDSSSNSNFLLNNIYF